MRKFIAFGPALVVLLTALVTLVAAPAAVRLIGYAGTDAQITLARATLDQDNVLKQIDRAVRAIADSVEPSVVHIGVEEPGMRGGWVRRSQGSGWVYDATGNIVTNAHVVRGANRIVVQFQDGRAAQAKLVGMDPNTDIAVISVTTNEGLFPVARATNVELHQGERVYAFGSPFGFKFSMSEGIVSGLGRDPRSVIGEAGYTNFIQTDAAVNPGNSGGPLVNVEGKLVGMNVAIATSGNGQGGEGQSSGISFAIPLTTIERVAEQLIGGGVVTRGKLGIRHQPNDDANTAALNQLQFNGRGVLVTFVEPSGPAANVGIKVGDVITKINTQQITSVPQLRSAISNNLPGDRITIEYVRAGESAKAEVTLGRLNGPAEQRAAAIRIAKFGLDDIADISGPALQITAVQEDSPAFRAGMRANQILVEVGGRPVKNTETFFEALADSQFDLGKPVTLRLRLEDSRKTIDIEVPGN